MLKHFLKIGLPQPVTCPPFLAHKVSNIEVLQPGKGLNITGQLRNIIVGDVKIGQVRQISMLN